MRKVSMPPMHADPHGAAVGLWTRAPVGSFRSQAVPGTAQYFQDLRAYRYGYETPFIPRLFQFARMAGRRVLEIGVGNGTDAVAMARCGAAYTGIDVTPRHLELTQANFALAQLAPPTLVCGDLLATDLSETYDFVYSFGVMHHIPNEAAYLQRVRDLLAPGGRLLLGVYSKYSFFNAYLCLTWLMQRQARCSLDDWRSHKAELSALGEPVTIRIRSRRACERLLRACGFRVQSYHKRGFVQNYLPLLGRHLQPDGVTLNTCGAVLGWYHLFECTVARAAQGS
jgi:SAM-dependent methyltransferase